MAGNKDIPRVQNPPQGDGHHVTYRYMTATELAERDARQNAYDAMLARQEAFEHSREVAVKKADPIRAGCVFAKSCKLSSKGYKNVPYKEMHRQMDNQNGRTCNVHTEQMLPTQCNSGTAGLPL